MLNSGKKYILTLVLSEKKLLNETKNHNPRPPPPFKLNGRSLKKAVNPAKLSKGCKLEAQVSLYRSPDINKSS